jgi:AcrR family transcriptional regulator
MNNLDLPAAPGPVKGDSPTATRTAILDAAEQLFSKNGVEGTSMRDISKAAGVNLGAINYHFGTKDRLALEAFARRLQPANRERIARLNALEAAAGRRKLKLEAIIDALVRPAVESEERATPECMRMVSRCFQEPSPALRKFVEQEFAEVVTRFDAAILRAVPALAAGEVFWRMCFIFGALQHGMEMWLRFDQMLRMPGVQPVLPDREGLIRRVVSFAAAGLSAPDRESPPGGARSRGRRMPASSGKGLR